MQLSHKHAIVAGVTAIAAVLGLQAFNGFACYGMSIVQLVSATAIFVLVPLLPALISIFTANPLRAVGACVLFAPWLAFAYYTDCVRPYSGGGASMIYVAVLLWGTPSAVIGALLTAPILRLANVRVVGR